MAYASKELSKKVREQLKAEFPEIKFSVRIEHHMALNVTIVKAPYNFMEHRASVQLGGFKLREDSNYQSDTANERFPFKHIDVLNRIIDIINCDNYDRSDIMTDYFDVGYYVHFNIGSWNKPFVFVQ